LMQKNIKFDSSIRIEETFLLNQEQQKWPPNYTLRKSRRAKYLQLKMCPEAGLEVVVPHRFGHYDIDDLLSTYRDWIEKKLKLYYSKSSQNTNLPTKIHLLMCNEVWQIQQLSALGSTKLHSRPDNTLIVMGDLSDIESAQILLKKWLRQKAKSLLEPLMAKLSAETNLCYKKITLREQKSRWGSCSSNGTIALNCKLIFLPLHLVRYILIHELCHTRHFNHSKHFWSLVSQFDPHFVQHRREINARYKELGRWGSES